jgi:cytochrome c-type biogenesis protein CcmF
VRSTLTSDVQLALVPPSQEGSEGLALGGDEIRLRMVVQPLVAWLWIGGGIIVLGTILSAIPTRRHIASGRDEIRSDVEPEPSPSPDREVVGVS